MANMQGGFDEGEDLFLLTDEQLSAGIRVLPPSLLSRHDQNGSTPLATGVTELTLRLTVELLVDVPPERRYEDWERHWSIQELSKIAWLGGWGLQGDITTLITALWSLDEMRFGMEVDGGTQWRKMFDIPLIPAVGMDPDLMFSVTIPYQSVSGWGGFVHLPKLREMSALSNLAYRCGIAFAQIWGGVPENRSGSFVGATRPRAARDLAGRLVDASGDVILDVDGAPANDWAIPGVLFLDSAGRRVPLEKAARERNPFADVYPVLSEEDTITACYPTLIGVDNRDRRFALVDRVREVIASMQERGYCLIEEVDTAGSSGWRVMPPEGWGTCYTSGDGAHIS